MSAQKAVPCVDEIHQKLFPSPNRIYSEDLQERTREASQWTRRPLNSCMLFIDFKDIVNDINNFHLQDG